MAWIESHQSLRSHRKLLNLASILKADRHKLIGHLHCLWWWALDNVPVSGSLGVLSANEMAMAAEWDGDAGQFLQALTDAGFIDLGPPLQIHNWDIYGGRLQQVRAKNRERMRVHRTFREHSPHVIQTFGATGPNPTVQRRGEASPLSPSEKIKPIWEPEEWFLPLTQLSGYRQANHSGAQKVISLACAESGADKEEVVKGFCADWPVLKASYALVDPVAALRGAKVLQVAIRKTKGDGNPRKSFSTNGRNKPDGTEASGRKWKNINDDEEETGGDS